MSFEQIVEKETRLVVLRILSEQPDERLNSSLIEIQLRESWAINRTREWVHTQLRFLADIGALRVSEAGLVLIAELTRRGRDHVERRIVLDGVKKPSSLES
jgi:hypothetical protein